MNDYELTDRGKIALTVVLAVLLFFLPAAILIFNAIANQPPDIPIDDDSKASASPPASPIETPPSVTAESPPPNGGGFNPPGTSPPTGAGSGEQGTTGGQSPSPPPGSGQTTQPPPGSGQTTPQPPGAGQTTPQPPGPGQTTPQPPSPGQGNVDSTAGTLWFLFSPYENGKFDTGVFPMLDEFINSPKNTRDNVIAVETPKLTDEVGEIFIPAITDALSSKGVEEGRIAFITNQRIPLADAFEVNLYYLPQRGK